MYRDKETGRIYTKWELYKRWFFLDAETLKFWESLDITTFDEWLECATDMGGELEVIHS